MKSELQYINKISWEKAPQLHDINSRKSELWLFPSSSDLTPTQAARLMTPTRTSAYDNEWHEIRCIFRQLATRDAEIQLGKLLVGGFHKPKQRQTFRPGTHFQRRITDCSIGFQINTHVNLASFLNIWKHMVFLCFSRVKNLHTAPLTCNCKFIKSQNYEINSNNFFFFFYSVAETAFCKKSGFCML